MTVILALESSCDETAVAILQGTDGAWQVLAEEISSQSEIHELYGGVVPELASREHLKNFPLLIDQVLQRSKIKLEDIDCIAVTRGPGLKGCLLIGLGIAKGLSLACGIPIIGVNHIEGHLLSPMLDNPKLTFPFLSLIVSGGHTEIQQVSDVGRYRCLVRTNDDAAGEAFDKSAHLLGLPYPGGPRLAGLADSVTRSRYSLPKVMREAEGFSFSGLKTAISLLVQRERANFDQDEALRAELAFAIQESIVDALIFKTKQAVQQSGIKRVAVAGGVAANRRLREQLGMIPGVDVWFPSQQHCMDNAAMIGFAGGLRFLAGDRSAQAISPLPRWAAEEVLSEAK